MREQCRQFLERLETAWHALEAATPATWGPWLRTLVKLVQTHPLTAAAAREVPATNETQIVWVKFGDPPADDLLWGTHAYAAAAGFVARESKPHAKTALPGLAQGLFGEHDNPQWPAHRASLNAYFVAPMIGWAKTVALSGPALEDAVENWCRRVEWFGLPPNVSREAADGRLQELRLGDDLHRFLFDAGLDFVDSGREHLAARGRVDFLIRAGHRTGVELKVWRRGTGATDLRAWRQQASDYAGDLAVDSIYLLVANDDAQQRLVVGPTLADGHYFVAGRPCFVRVVDIHRIASSKEGRLRGDRVLGADDFHSAIA